MFYLAESERNQSYLHGAVILATAVAVVRILGALFRVPLANIIGDDGMSTFQVASNIYAVLLSLSTAGLPVALSKMISASATLERPQQVRRVFAVGRNAFLFLGVISFLVMAIFYQELANFFRSPTAAYAILALSPAMLFVCLLSAYRGYCQGFSIMMPTSVSQVIEATARFLIGLGLAWLLMRHGFSEGITVAGATAGVTVGAALACIYLFFTRRKVEREITWSGSLDTPDSNRRIARNLLNIAVPLTLGASIFSIINLADTRVIMGQLQTAGQASGLSPEAAYDMARSLNGTYAFTMPVFNLPSSFVIPITVALIPAISAFLAKGDGEAARKTATSGIRVTCLLALPAAVGITVLAEPIMHALYYGRFAAQGPGLMAYMGVAAFFLCFFQATNCVLQAYGFQRYTVYTLTIGGIIKVVITWILLADPRVSIYGAAISTVVCYVVICVINMALVKRRIPNSPSFLQILTKPILCAAAMGAAAWASFGILRSLTLALLDGIGLSPRFLWAIPLAGAIGIAMVVYLILIIALRAITLEDMQMLPKGEKLTKLLRVR